MDIVNYLLKRHNICLNEQQKDGVLCNSTSTLLLAVPGSGKTTVLVSRIANLIINYNVDPQKILTVTYSKESARDMTRRFDSLYGEIIDIKPKFCTIHSLCYNVMKRHSIENSLKMPTLISDLKGQRIYIIKEIYKKLSGNYLNDDVFDTISDRMSFVKNMMFNQKQIQETNSEIKYFSELFFEFERYKKKNNLYEYDDMLVYCYKLFCRRPDLLSFFTDKYHYINVDEAQDSSLIQFNIIKLLVDNNSVFMVGDDDQSIYAFRGAFPQYLVNFSSFYNNALIIKMEKNYRSNSDIVNVANNFIKSNQQRVNKTMISDKLAENSVEIIELDDYCNQCNNIVQYICKLPNDKSVAIIYRNNNSAIPIINQMIKRNINYYIKDSINGFFNSTVVRDILSYLKLANDMTDVTAFSQIFYKLGISIGEFEFVRDNINNNKDEDVFTVALKISMLKDAKREEINFYRYGFKKLSKMDASRAIAYIMDSLSYKRYIESRVKNQTTKILSYHKLAILTNIAESGDDITTFYEKVYSLEKNIYDRKFVSNSSNITFSTMHSCKGLEFDEVIIIDTIKDIIPTVEALKSSVIGELDQIEAETRLFYVALTRAKSKLIIYKSSKLNCRFIQQSCFVSNLFKQRIAEINMQVPDLIDTIIEHEFFGKGIVTQQSGDILSVDFEQVGKKSISYTICKNADLLY